MTWYDAITILFWVLLVSHLLLHIIGGFNG
jgi:hypothetical protein